MVIVNRLLALVLGAAILAGGLLVMLEAIWAWTGSGFVWIPEQQWLRAFKTTEWSDPLVIAVSIGVALVGLILLVAQLRPQRRRLAAFETDHDSWWLLRRSAESHLERCLEAVVPTSPIKTRLDPKRRWQLKVTARAATSTRPTLEAAARAELERLRAPDARVQIKTTGKAGGT
jgi:hypothetical protein